MSGAERLAILDRVMAMPGFPKWAGMRLICGRAWQGDDGAVARQPELMSFGYFHGGVITALPDHAAGACATSSLPEGKVAVTVEIKVNFLSPADGEEIIARAETIQAGSSIAVIKIDVASRKAGAERACAFATATMRAVDMPAGFR